MQTVHICNSFCISLLYKGLPLISWISGHVHYLHIYTHNLALISLLVSALSNLRTLRKLNGIEHIVYALTPFTVYLRGFVIWVTKMPC